MSVESASASVSGQQHPHMEPSAAGQTNIVGEAMPVTTPAPQPSTTPIDNEAIGLRAYIKLLLEQQQAHKDEVHELLQSRVALQADKIVLQAEVITHLKTVGRTERALVRLQDDLAQAEHNADQFRTAFKCTNYWALALEASQQQMRDQLGVLLQQATQQLSPSQSSLQPSHTQSIQPDAPQPGTFHLPPQPHRTSQSNGQGGHAEGGHTASHTNGTGTSGMLHEPHKTQAEDGTLAIALSLDAPSPPLATLLVESVLHQLMEALGRLLKNASEEAQLHANVSGLDSNGSSCFSRLPAPVTNASQPRDRSPSPTQFPWRPSGSGGPPPPTTPVSSYMGSPAPGVLWPSAEATAALGLTRAQIVGAVPTGGGASPGARSPTGPSGFPSQRTAPRAPREGAGGGRAAGAAAADGLSGDVSWLPVALQEHGGAAGDWRSAAPPVPVHHVQPPRPPAALLLEELSLSLPSPSALPPPALAAPAAAPHAAAPQALAPGSSAPQVCSLFSPGSSMQQGPSEPPLSEAQVNTQLQSTNAALTRQVAAQAQQLTALRKEVELLQFRAVGEIPTPWGAPATPTWAGTWAGPGDVGRLETGAVLLVPKPSISRAGSGGPSTVALANPSKSAPAWSGFQLSSVLQPPHAWADGSSAGPFTLPTRASTGGSTGQGMSVDGREGTPPPGIVLGGISPAQSRLPASTASPFTPGASSWKGAGAQPWTSLPLGTASSLTGTGAACLGLGWDAPHSPNPALVGAHGRSSSGGGAGGREAGPPYPRSGTGAVSPGTGWDVPAPAPHHTQPHPTTLKASLPPRTGSHHHSRSSSGGSGFSGFKDTGGLAAHVTPGALGSVMQRELEELDALSEAVAPRSIGPQTYKDRSATATLK